MLFIVILILTKAKKELTSSPTDNANMGRQPIWARLRELKIPQETHGACFALNLYATEVFVCA